MTKAEAPLGIALEAPQATKTDTFRLGYIDGLRAIAMLMVMACHGWQGFFYTAHVSLFGRRLELAHFQEAGYLGVDLFLILSGFCLFYPFISDEARPEPTLAQFFLKRVRRIVPPYYAAVLIFGMISWFHCLPPPNPQYDHHYLLRWFAYHAVLLHNTQPTYIGSLNATMWSMGLEWQLYFFFPLLFVAYRRWSPRLAFLIVLVLNGAFRYYLHSHNIVNEPILLFVLPYSAFGRVFEFALGMYVAFLMAQQRRLGRSPLNWADWLALILAGLEAARETRREVLIGTSIPTLPELISSMLAFLPELAWAVCFGAAIFFASRPGWVNRALSWPPLMRLGLFSYSIYLVQGSLLWPLCNFLKPFLHSAWIQFAAEWLLIVPVVIAVGYAFHLAFERPYMSSADGAARLPAWRALITPHLEASRRGAWAAGCLTVAGLLFGMMATMTWHKEMHQRARAVLSASPPAPVKASVAGVRQ